MPFDSWFEVDVFLRLVDRGFRVIPQFEMAGKRIDLLVEGMRGRLAVECDGDDWHGLEQWEADVARQRMLERCGLEFWRVRGSTFYRDQEQALSSLWEALESRGIRANGEPDVSPAGVVAARRSSDQSSNENDDEAGVPASNETELEGDDRDEEVDSPEPFDFSSGTLFEELPLEPYRSWAQQPLPDPHTASLSEVMEGLLQIIEVEGPMVSRRAYSLYNKAVGGARLGRQTAKIMNRAVNKAIRSGRLRQGEKDATGNYILQLSDRPIVIIRTRGPRRLEEIPCTEIAAVRQAVRSRYPSLDEEQLVRRLAECFGIVRKTPQVRKMLLG
jgi:very-short-patch-repair endonuclease